MATLVLGAIGTALGGPLGGALGALAGRSIDQAVIGSPKREGPRLEELSISSSSYGQPIGRHYGRMRVAGSIIWATDLAESSETSGGGKGKPKVTTYNYSISMAVALASRPIDGVGRIWADGNLLRGAAGDLKAGGQMRLYRGAGDQDADPLMAAALGAQCPAHRGLAYVVFEDLQLGDFGNRIPALTFEVFAGAASDAGADIARLAGLQASSDCIPPQLAGFSLREGTLAQTFQLLSNATPLAGDASAPTLLLAPQESDADGATTLPPPCGWEEGEFGQQAGYALERRAAEGGEPSGLRYYDTARDYQPGLQRRAGRSNGNEGSVADFPAALAPADARRLLQAVDANHPRQQDRLAWRIAQLDPAHAPGKLVRTPGHPGLWRVEAWEWREGGVELNLSRWTPRTVDQHSADPGRAWSPRDRLPVATLLRGFELPWDGTGSPDRPLIYAAASAADGRWAGASLYADLGGALTPLALAPPQRAISGALLQPLRPSHALMVEHRAELAVRLDSPEMALAPTSLAGLAQGANKLLIGEEVVQFLESEETAPGEWTLRGLLRGRGGTEHIAQDGHDTGAKVTLIDDRLVALDPAMIDPAVHRLSAIGVADQQPVDTVIEGAGVSLRPLAPVHARIESAPDGAWTLRWTRRARGAWSWSDGHGTPLVEGTELYEIGLGPVGAPYARWQATQPNLTIAATDRASLAAAHPGAVLWVRQIGSHAASLPLLLAKLPTQ